MKITRTNLFSWALVVLSFALVAALYQRMPESVPTHWNARGEVDDTTAKPWGPFLLPLILFGVQLVFVLIPRISPRGYRVERFQKVFEIMQAGVVAFLFFVSLLVALAGTGKAIAMDRAIYAATGLLFVLIGNFLGKVTKNFFVGIRTPWTLASDEVWLRTHRLGGKLFVVAGIGLFVSALLGAGAVAVLVATGVAAVIPVVYSYVLYRRNEGFKNG